MTGDRVQPRALRKLTLDIRNERRRGVFRRSERRRLAENLRIDRDQPPRLLIGGAAHHDAVDMRQMRKRLVDTADAAIEHDSKLRMRAP